MVNVKIFNNDCIEVMKSFSDSTIDAIITDPPYGLSDIKPAEVNSILSKWASGERSYIPNKKGFLNNDWDSFVPPPSVWDECFRVLKPGGYAAVFSSTRNQDLMCLSLRLAGFEVRDCLAWVYATGMPKSSSISKGLEKAGLDNTGFEGYGSALKPGYEPIILVRKPVEKTLYNNVDKYSTGGINIDDCRIYPKVNDEIDKTQQGRFPANIMFDKESAVILDKQSGHSKGRPAKATLNGGVSGSKKVASNTPFLPGIATTGYTDEGGASRFFHVFSYHKKTPSIEKPFIVEEDGSKTTHPTVKPLSLMKWLVELLSPPNSPIILDPFSGSGSTLEACILSNKDCIGIELSDKYTRLIEKRLEKHEDDNIIEYVR